MHGSMKMAIVSTRKDDIGIMETDVRTIGRKREDRFPLVVSKPSFARSGSFETVSSALKWGHIHSNDEDYLTLHNNAN